VTKLNGIEVDRRVVTEGSNAFQVFKNPVEQPQEATVAVSVGDKLASTVVTFQPVRKLRAYIPPHSHHHLGCIDIQSKIEERQMHNIAMGTDLARKTANYPEGARFVWNLEVLWGADLSVRMRGISRVRAKTACSVDARFCRGRCARQRNSARAWMRKLATCRSLFCTEDPGT
jgi:hypothetical protein